MLILLHLNIPPTFPILLYPLVIFLLVLTLLFHNHTSTFLFLYFLIDSNLHYSLNAYKSIL
jgi:hypothetical protein